MLCLMLEIPSQILLILILLTDIPENLHRRGGGIIVSIRMMSAFKNFLFALSLTKVFLWLTIIPHLWLEVILKL